MRSVNDIFMLYLYWNFIYVGWRESCHSLNVAFIFWFTQLMPISYVHTTARGLEKSKRNLPAKKDSFVFIKINSTACDCSWVTGSHLEELLTRNYFMVCIADCQQIATAAFVWASIKSGLKYWSPKKDFSETILAVMIGVWTVCWMWTEVVSYATPPLLVKFRINLDEAKKLTWKEIKSYACMG